MAFRILVRGGGDLASGVVLRLHRAGWQVLVTELQKPLAVRRFVSFAQAIYDGEIEIEGIRARLVATMIQARAAFSSGEVAVMVDPHLDSLGDFQPHVMVDARMRKSIPEVGREAAPLVIGLGPGFSAGVDCHAVIETNRGPFLGRVIWDGPAQDDTGIPEQMGQFRFERVLRAPVDGVLEQAADIGSMLKRGDLIASVGGRPVTAPFNGVLRGLVYGGLSVRQGEKIGDIDPRGDARLCWMASDKALSVGGGVLEAILSWKPVRSYWHES